MTAHRAGIIAGSLKASFNWAVACWRDKTDQHVDNNDEEGQTADVKKITYSHRPYVWQSVLFSHGTMTKSAQFLHGTMTTGCQCHCHRETFTTTNYTERSIFTCWITALSGCVSCNRICSSSSDILAPKLGFSLRWMSEWGFKSWEEGRVLLSFT